MSDIEKYRRLVVNSWGINSCWDKCLLEIESYWHEELKRSRGKYNHPLVNSKKAYWTNNTTLCYGYKLKTNNDIYRPIFSHNIHDLKKFTHTNIKNTVVDRKKRMIDAARELSMSAYVQFFKIKILPKDVLDLIFKISGGYDWWTK
mgnify:CR=1 FL=1